MIKPPRREYHWTFHGPEEAKQADWIAEAIYVSVWVLAGASLALVIVLLAIQFAGVQG